MIVIDTGDVILLCCRKDERKNTYTAQIWAVLFYPGEVSKMAPTKRSDRAPGNRGAFEKARRRVLATQDTCGICGKPVDMSLKYPHPMSPTVDHIIPVSKGGHPSDINNLQLAHRCCNRQKSDKLLAERYATTSDLSTKIISNRVLEQHADWKKYKAPKGTQ